MLEHLIVQQADATSDASSIYTAAHRTGRLFRIEPHKGVVISVWIMRGEALRLFLSDQLHPETLAPADNSFYHPATNFIGI